MSVLFVVLMLFLCWQIQRIHTGTIAAATPSG